jgi:hypothetical protein
LDCQESSGWKKKLSSTNVSPGEVLHAATPEVNQFHECAESSMIVLGKKMIPFLLVQKPRNNLHCVTELFYLSFKEKDPEKLQSFSAFAELKPETVLAEESGTYAVCVYTIHQNLKRMISAEKSYNLTKKQGKLTN